MSHGDCWKPVLPGSHSPQGPHLSRLCSPLRQVGGPRSLCTAEEAGSRFPSFTQPVSEAGPQGAPRSWELEVFWKGRLTLSLSPSGFFEMKMKYDESDNAFIRASRALTDKVTDLLGEWVAPELSFPTPTPLGRQQGGVPSSLAAPGLAAPRGPVLEDGNVRGAHGDPACGPCL